MNSTPRARFVAELGPRIQHAVLAFDFDGTLSPIVEDPALARPAAGAVATLEQLAALGARIALVTGREATTVLRLSGLAHVPGLIVSGVYGAQAWRDGRLAVVPTPPAIEQMRHRLPTLLPPGTGLWVEDKQISLVVQGRGSAAASLSTFEPLLRAEAEPLGLEVHPGRSVLEVRVPGLSKGSAVRDLLMMVDAHVLVYCGDDVGDVPAFEELRRQRAGGRLTWSVAVRSDEVPTITRHADLAVADPDELVALLREVVEA
ncbi:MAG: trehalose-phosphatase, partial [Actinobacteria bacterium]|nr:trehalose-phosphatase [Actinomycetota bacterium]